MRSVTSARFRRVHHTASARKRASAPSGAPDKRGFWLRAPARLLGAIVFILFSQFLPYIPTAAAHGGLAGLAAAGPVRNYVTLVHPARAAAAAAPARPGTPGFLPASSDATLAPTTPATVYTIGTSGFSGESQTSDPVGGWGDDEWDFNFKTLMTISVNVTDCCIVGDNYGVYINNTLIGVTPPEPLFGSTLSQGTFSRMVAPGFHRIRIRDFGGVNYGIIPAGYSVTISVSAASPDRPVIFIHGIGQNSADMGNSSSGDGFYPIYQQLHAIYGPDSVETFAYDDDRSMKTATTPCPAKLYPQCQSQSSVFTNAKDLAAGITALAAKKHHKVTLIGYSMGGAIIRNVLAGCLSAPGTTAACPGVSNSIDSVFFIDAVQQGSWVMGAKSAFLDAPLNSSDPLSDMRIILGWDAYSWVKSHMELDAYLPAEADLAADSQAMQASASVPVPYGIAYFNFYGDIRVGFGNPVNIGPLHLAPSTFPVGDLVLLPGADDPAQLQQYGGAEFCPSCANHGSYRSAHPTSHTSFTEWPLTDTRYIGTSLVNWAACLPKIGAYMPASCLGNIASAPEMHTNIPTTSALNSILVKDTTGYASAVTLPTEIVLQLEQIDGIIP